MDRLTNALMGQTALITGGAKRIGHAVALSLASYGVRLVIHHNTSSMEAEELVNGIRDYGINAWSLQADLSDPEQAAGLIQRATDLAGPLSFLINNAGIFPTSHLDDCTVDDLQANMTVNAFSPMVLARDFARQTQEGLIVNFLDARIWDYDKEHVAYHLSKRMLHSITMMMALELAPGIRVNAVAPGLILPPEGKEESYLQELAHTNPLNRYGDVWDVCDAILFLAQASFVTGQVIYLDGGRHLKGNLYG